MAGGPEQWQPGQQLPPADPAAAAATAAATGQSSNRVGRPLLLGRAISIQFVWQLVVVLAAAAAVAAVVVAVPLTAINNKIALLYPAPLVPLGWVRAEKLELGTHTKRILCI